MAGMHPETGRFTRDGEEIIVAVRKAFTTPKATRVMRRHLGVAHGALLDRPSAPGMLGPVTLAIGETLAAEPRVQLERIGLASVTQQGAVELVAELTIVSSGQSIRETL